MSYAAILCGNVLIPGDRMLEDFGDGIKIEKSDVAIGGEAAMALRAFMRGEFEFPVSANGIVQLARGWEERKRAMAFGEPPRTQQLTLTPDPTEWARSVMQPTITPPIATNKPVDAGLPRLNLEKIAQAMKESHGAL